MNLSQYVRAVIVSLTLILLFATCQGTLDCAPPPPSLHFALTDSLGAPASDRFATSLRITYVTNGQTRPASVEFIPSSGVAGGTFRLFPATVTSGVTTYSIQPGNGKTYPLDISISQSSGSCGPTPTIESATFNGTTFTPAQWQNGMPVVFRL